jgi:hypothetical protein
MILTVMEPVAPAGAVWSHNGQLLHYKKRKIVQLSVGKCPYIRVRQIIPSVVRGIFLLTSTV